MASSDGTPGTSPEMIAKLTAAANQIAWKKPALDVLRPELKGQYSALMEEGLRLQFLSPRSIQRRLLLVQQEEDVCYKVV
jgi:hypothetical protein